MLMASLDKLFKKSSSLAYIIAATKPFHAMQSPPRVQTQLFCWQHSSVFFLCLLLASKLSTVPVQATS